MEGTTLEGKTINDIAANEDLFETFICGQRFYLSRRIYPLGTFYAYMISKNVLRQEDQDDAESHPVRLNKVGRFLDIVATKGPLGFRAFLDVLEYEYPHVYWHVANEKPRDAPKGWRPSTPMSAGSVRLKQKMTDLISGLSEDAEEKRQKNNELQEYIMEIEKDHRKEKENLKRDLEEMTSQNADLHEAERKYKTELDELRLTSCSNRDVIEKMRQEISVLSTQRILESRSVDTLKRGKSLDVATAVNAHNLPTAMPRSKHEKEIAIVQAQLEIFRDSESQLLLDLTERKEDYNRLVLEYAKMEQECGELRNKMESCEEEASYYQNKSGDLASEFNALLDAFQRSTQANEEEPISPATLSRNDVQMRTGKTIVGVPPTLQRRIGMSEQNSLENDESSVVILHAPSDIQEQLYKKLLDIPSQRVSSGVNSRIFTSFEMESYQCSEAVLQRSLQSGAVLHYEEKSRDDFVVLKTHRLNQAVRCSSQHVLLLMPPYKEFTIRIREAGFKFIVIAVTVEHIPESQLIRSLRARLTRHDLALVTVPKCQLADIDALSKNVSNRVQETIKRHST